MTRGGSADQAAQYGVFDSQDTTRGASRTSSPQIPHPRTSPEGVSNETRSQATVENRLRGRMVDRLTLMADRHRRHVEEQHGTRRAVGAHALGFFYADDLSMSGEVEVVAATRLFFDSAETAMIDRASEHPAGTFDPRIHLCNRAESMSYAPELLGIGVTTVYEPPLIDASSAYASLGMNRPYKAVARMEDGTDILLRCDSGFLAPVDVRSSQSLNVNGRSTRHWEWLPSALLHSPETQLRDILPSLSTLLDLAAGRATSTLAGHAAPAPASPARGGHRVIGRRSVRLGGASRRR
jgi:hypothetical protein